jgi:manganese/iron transport system ATP-binding protein
VTYRTGLVALQGASFGAARLDHRARRDQRLGQVDALQGDHGLRAAGLGHGRDPRPERDAALAANLVAYVPQAEEVDWTFPVLVEDVVMMGRYGHMNWLRRPGPRDRALVAEALERVGMTASGATADRRAVGRAEEAGVPRPRAGAGGAGHPARRALHRRRRADRGADRAAPAELRAEGRVMLISTHNLGSVPEFCDRVILINRRILAEGPTAEVFTRANIERAFGGTLRHYVLGGTDLHEDADARQVTVITDDERPFVIYDEDPKDRGDATR